MSLQSWLQNVWSLAPSRAQRRRQISTQAATQRPSLEVLEDRCVPALYAVTELGTLGGYGSSAADFNQAGQVVGVTGSHAVLWDNGAVIDLGTLGGNWSVAHAINDLGQVVGRGTLPGEQITHAFLVTPQGGVWFRDNDLDGRNDFMIDLGTLNGATIVEPVDINNAGQVVGTAFSSGGQAFLWDPVNGMTALPAPAGTYTYAGGINEFGQVAGQVWFYDPLTGGGPNSACLWDATGGMTVLGAGPGYTNSYASVINDVGQVAGGRWNAPGEIAPPAFLWTPDAPNGPSGSFIDLGLLPGADLSEALAINNAGQVVGSSSNVAYDESENYYWYYNPRAFLWDATDGMVNLQDQLLPGSDATLQYAAAINDDGAIVVDGYNSLGEGRAYLLTPIPSDTPTISIADAQAVTEGNTGASLVTFTVTMSEVSNQTVTVDFSTAAGSATAGSDYQTLSGTLTFATGTTRTTFSVLVNGDRLAEPTETFVVNLSSPTNAVIVDGHGVGAILDDEPRISINDRTITEGNTSGVSAMFTVTLSHTYDEDVVVPWTTATGSATAASDYSAASGSVIIAAGQVSNTITVMVTGDRLPEPTETFFVNLGNPANAAIADGQGVGTIIDNEPRISISDVTKAEGRKGKTTLFTFTVTLSVPYDQPVTMSFQTVNGTAKTSDNDYVAKSGTLTIAPGEMTKTITIEVKGDSKKEANETFYLDLFGLSSNVLFTKNRGLGTILNDD